jgi:hypothetical protein
MRQSRPVPQAVAVAERDYVGGVLEQPLPQDVSSASEGVSAQ